MSEMCSVCFVRAQRDDDDFLPCSPRCFQAALRACEARVREGWYETQSATWEQGYAAGVQAAREALVAAGHTPWGIYDECECPAEVREQDGHIINLIEFSGCEKSLVYWACRECCTDDGYHNEACATYHDHGEGKPYCLAVAAIDALLEGTHVTAPERKDRGEA